jgi:hypothetical protein
MAGAAASAGGSRTVKTEPLPSSLRTRSSPPWAWTICWQMGSPRPVPSAEGLVVKNGSKMRDSTVGEMPQPVSDTSTRARPESSRPVRTRTSWRSGLPSGMAWSALTSRLSITCPSRASLPITLGG